MFLASPRARHVSLKKSRKARLPSVPWIRWVTSWCGRIKFNFFFSFFSFFGHSTKSVCAARHLDVLTKPNSIPPSLDRSGLP